MGLRGPAPKPTALKKLAGNPGKRPLNDREPQARLAIPKCPAHLDAIAKKEWKRISKLLLGMKVLTEADYIALGNLCQAYSTQIQAQNKLSQTGLLFKTRSGYVQQSPLFTIVATQQSIVNKLLAEFGLTPSSRSRLQIQPAAEEKVQNKFAALGARPDPKDDELDLSLLQ
jgi:P27 family predicted phage terminase small subunit